MTYPPVPSDPEQTVDAELAFTITHGAFDVVREVLHREGILRSDPPVGPFLGSVDTAELSCWSLQRRKNLLITLQQADVAAHMINLAQTQMAEVAGEKVASNTGPIEVPPTS